MPTESETERGECATNCATLGPELVRFRPFGDRTDSVRLEVLTDYAQRGNGG